MCGIAGMITAETGRLDLASVAEQMQGTLTHRGPDDRGLFISDGRCALAHTRLSILDLSPAGHQPMGLGELGEIRNSKFEIRNEQQARYWITYNGEIYNYRELRRELGAWSGVSQRSEDRDQRSEANNQRSEVGHQRSAVNNQRSDIRGQKSELNSEIRNSKFEIWNSNTDTEVILRAYARWGRECVNHLRGMFAFAIWDEQERELFLARDPFGIKPLYYYQTEHSFLFASEIRALLASGSVPRKLSLNGLASYLEFGSVQDPSTIIDGVRSLLPGHYLTVKRNNKLIETDQCSFSHVFTPHALPLTPHGNPTSRPEAVKLLRSKLEASVRQHLVSDVPVGAFLSGGIDSSAIVALMTKVAEQTPKTFSVVFSESEFSEAEHAQLVAKTFGTEHREIMLSEGHLLGMLPDALAAMDQPTMDGINTFVISKAVKEAGVTVALSGLGGDELFAGYPSFSRARQLHRLAIAPFGLRRFVSLVGRGMLNGDSRRRKFWDLVESDCTSYAAYSLSRQLFAPDEISALTRGQRSAVGRRKPEVRGRKQEKRGAWSGEHGAEGGGQFEIRNPQSEIESDVVNAVSRYELEGYIANTLLRDTDQMSMAHALEVRVPFIDPVVVKYVLGLPGEWKTNGKRPKPLLVETLGDSLPEEIWKRPKMGFTLPFQRWLRSGLQPKLGHAFSDADGLERFGLNSDRVRDVWATFKNNPQQEPWSRPWSLYVLKQWCELNGVTGP